MKKLVLGIIVPLSLILLAGGTSSSWLPPLLRRISARRTFSKPAPNLPHLGAAPAGYHLTYQRYLENSYTEVFEGEAGNLEISVRGEGPKPDHCAALAPFLPLATPRYPFEQSGTQGIVFRREDANHDRLAFTLLFPGKGACVKIEQRPAPHATSKEEPKPEDLSALLREMQPTP